MPTNQKYSGRIHARRQLVSVDTHLKSCMTILIDVGLKYTEAKPEISLACAELINLIQIIPAMVNRIRNEI